MASCCKEEGEVVVAEEEISAVFIKVVAGIFGATKLVKSLVEVDKSTAADGEIGTGSVGVEEEIFFLKGGISEGIGSANLDRLPCMEIDPSGEREGFPIFLPRVDLYQRRQDRFSNRWPFSRLSLHFVKTFQIALISSDPADNFEKLSRARVKTGSGSLMTMRFGVALLRGVAVAERCFFAERV